MLGSQLIGYLGRIRRGGLGGGVSLTTVRLPSQSSTRPPPLSLLLVEQMWALTCYIKTMPP